MLARLKQQPLLSLTLAIAAGYVLAHIVTRALDITYADALGSDPAAAAAWLCAIALALCAAWQRRAILAFAKSHVRSLAWAGIAVLCIFSALAFRAAVISAHETLPVR